MRNILSTDEVSAELVRKANEVLSVPPAEWSDEAKKKVAKQVVSFEFDDDEDDGGDADPKSPMEELEDEMVMSKKRFFYGLRMSSIRKKRKRTKILLSQKILLLIKTIPLSKKVCSKRLIVRVRNWGYFKVSQRFLTPEKILLMVLLS